MSFVDDLFHNIGNFFNGGNQQQNRQKPTPRPPVNSLRSQVVRTQNTGNPLVDGPDPAQQAAQQRQQAQQQAAEEAKRKAAEEAARKAEVARLAAQAVRDTNQQLGQDYATIGGDDLKAMASEASKGGDANLEVIKMARQKILQRRQQKIAQPTAAAAVQGAPAAVNATLNAKRNAVIQAQMGVANGHAEPWQINNALVDYHNELKRTQDVAEASKIAQTDPHTLINSFNSMDDAGQRKVLDQLTKVATDYSRAGSDPELFQLGQQAAAKLSMLQAKKDELQKNGLPEVKRHNSAGGIIGDIGHEILQAPVTLASKLAEGGDTAFKVLTGQNSDPFKHIDDMLKRREITPEEHARLTGQLNQRLTGMTGSDHGEDFGTLDRAARSLGTAAEAASYAIPGAGVVDGLAARTLGDVGKNALIDAGTNAVAGGLTALEQGKDARWQDALTNAGIAGTVGGVIRGATGLSNFTKHIGVSPEEFSSLSHEAQVELVKAAQEAAQREAKLAPTTQTPETPVTEPAPTPTPESKVSPNAIDRIAGGNQAAAKKVLDNSGITLTPEVRDSLSAQLAKAKTPEEVKAVLDANGIPSETPQDALARQTQQADQVTAEQDKALQEAPQDVNPPEPTPAPETAAPELANTADIKQSESTFTPTPGNQVDPQLTARAEEIKAIPVSKRTAAQKAELRSIGQQIKEQKAVSAVKNPALHVNKDGVVEPIGTTKAYENTRDVQTALEEDGAKVDHIFADRFMPMVNQVKALREKGATNTADVIDQHRVMSNKAIADEHQFTDEALKLGQETMGPMKKDSQELTKYLVENMSNTRLMKKYAKESPAEFAAAQRMGDWFKQVQPQLNEVLKAEGMKPIGNIKDYFPRMEKINSDKKISEDFRRMLDTSADGMGKYGQGTMSKSFLKARKQAEAGGKQLDPLDAFNLYATQVSSIIHRTPVIKRAEAIEKVIKASESLPQAAKKQLENIFTQNANQLSGKGVTPTHGLSLAAHKLTRITSGSQIMYSVNSIYSQIANPVSVIGSLYRQGLVKGSIDTANLVKNMAVSTGKGAKNLRELENIDGMRSDFLVNSHSHQTGSTKALDKVRNFGYRFSNFGDIQSKHSAVQTIYDRYVRDGAPRDMDTLHKAEDEVRYAIGDRTAGERSQFTASDNPIAIIAGQYQVEQIANVLNFLQGTIFTKSTSPWQKAVATTALAGAAFGANQATSFASNGQVKPLPDVIGAGLDAYGRVGQIEEDRKAAGEPPLTPEQKAGYFMSNMAAAFISNLPLGRAILAPANLAAVKADENKDLNNPNFSKELGANPRDTNPLQTLPAIGTVASLVDEGGKVISGKESPLDGIIHVGTKVLPGGGQAKKIYEGGTTFAAGQDKYPDTKKDDGTVEPGDVKFKVNNNLSTGEGWHNLVAMLASGKYATKDAQNYISSGFQTSSSRDVAGKTNYDKNMTDDQKKAFITKVNNQFKNTLKGDDKKIFTAMGNKDLLKLNLSDGKFSQDKVDELKAQKNRYLLDHGLVGLVDTGFSKEDMDKFTPEVRAFLVSKAVEGKKKYKEKSATDASKAVIAQALSDPWPTIDTSKITPTNALADKYVDYQKALQKAGNDQAAQYDARKKFWAATVKQAYDSHAVDVYDNTDDGGSTNAKGTYGMSITAIEKMVSSDGLKVGNKSYHINKKDLDSMIELDNTLLKAGLISQPKFSNKVREAYGYGDAPVDGASNAGYTGPKSKGGRGSKHNDANPLDYLSTEGTGSKGFDIKKGPSPDGAGAHLNLAPLRNSGSKSGKASIQIRL